MPRDDSPPSRNPDGKRPGNGTHGHPDRAGNAGPRRGRSGYGMESIRPHLRDQLEQRKLLRPTFPPEDPEENNRSNDSDG